MSEKYSVLVIEDHPIYREAICNLLQKVDIIANISEAENGKIGIDKIKVNQYDIVLLDIEMPILNGLETAKIIRSQFPKIKIIILSSHSERRYIVELMELGVSAYMSKNTTKDDFFKAIKCVSEDNMYFTPEIKEIYSDFLINKATKGFDNLDAVLTEREIEVLKLMCHQLSSAEIADKLCLSIYTINNHKARIMKRLKTDNAIGLALYAIRNSYFSIY